jgi:hypothetical protein
MLVVNCISWIVASVWIGKTRAWHLVRSEHACDVAILERKRTFRDSDEYVYALKTKETRKSKVENRERDDSRESIAGAHTNGLYRIRPGAPLVFNAHAKPRTRARSGSYPSTLQGENLQAWDHYFKNPERFKRYTSLICVGERLERLRQV